MFWLRFAARHGIHYGWVVAATTFLTMLVTAGAVGTPGVLFGLMGPFAAAFINRFGIRRVASIALLLIGAGIFSDPSR